MIALNLTPAAFLAWLQSWDAEAVVGYTHRGASCPLAGYLCSQSGIHTAFVSLDDVDYRAADCSDVQRAGLPEWAIAFVDMVDSGYGVNPVTAATALDIMALITRMEASHE